MNENAQVVMRTLDAVEARRFEELSELYHPEISFHWQPGLPYGGDFAGRSVATMTEAFRTAWEPLQPDAETRRMDAKIVAADGNHVIASYLWRGLDSLGRRFETETLAHYQVADGRLRDARMFYYDHAGVIAFLEAARRSGNQSPRT
jgi:ketosteroid isomerase-like protein